MRLASRFPGQKPDEKVLLVLHRHWVVLLKDLLIFIALIGLPAVVFFVAKNTLGWELATGSLGYIVLVMGGSLYCLFIWNLTFGYWLDYLLDYFVVTDQRVVDIDQEGLFNRTVAEQPLYRVQDVTTEVRGVWQTVLRYGNVYIQTAAEKQRFVFEQVPHPEEVAKQIITLSELAASNNEKRSNEQPSQPLETHSHSGNVVNETGENTTTGEKK